MFNRFFGSLRSLSANDTFEGYISGIYRHHRTGAPTADEAKKDYRAFVSTIRL